MSLASRIRVSPTRSRAWSSARTALSCAVRGLVWHGTSMVTTVGPPAGLSTTIVPSNAASRFATPARPEPAGSAPPRPSSPTTRCSTSPSCRTRTQARVASACLTVLARHSATAKYAADSTGGGSAGASTVTVIGSGIGSASASRPPASPRSASAGGWMPRTTERRSSSALTVVSRASRSSAAAASGSVLISFSARPTFMPTEAIRAWAPSCRSRSIRRTSAALWSRVSVRDVDDLLDPALELLDPARAEDVALGQRPAADQARGRRTTRRAGAARRARPGATTRSPRRPARRPRA